MSFRTAVKLLFVKIVLHTVLHIFTSVIQSAIMIAVLLKMISRRYLMTPSDKKIRTQNWLLPLLVFLIFSIILPAYSITNLLTIRLTSVPWQN